MQQRSQIPEADDKTTIQALIKGLTPGPTASHLTRKKPKTIDELFHELEEYIMSDDDHRRRVAERNEARQGNREMTWRPQFQNPRNINNVENPQPNQNNRLSTRGGFAPRERGRGRGRGPRCRMDLPGPTTSVGTRTDYSVGPWDYPACATRHLKAWSTRTT
jgi:hypothetical protein